MSFGFQFMNNSNVVTLDSEFARMVVLESGNYVPNSDGGINSVVSFSKVVTSQEPPLIFARPTTENGIAAISSVLIYGSPGAWTGFSIRSRSNDYLQPRGRWFVAAFKAQAVSTYGIQIWDGSGNLLFDGGNPCAVFTAAYQDWTYAFTQTLAIGVSNFFTTPKSFNETDYMLINNYSMNVMGGANSGSLISSLWDFPNGILYAVTTSASNSRGFYVPALFARLVV